MGVGRVNGTNSISGGQMVQTVDTLSKSIRNQITGIQRQMQEVSANEEMSVEEKMKRRQELQQEISSLNTKLRQHEAELRKEQQAKVASSNEVPAGNSTAENHEEGNRIAGSRAEGSDTTGNGTSEDTRGEDRKVEDKNIETGMSQTGMRAFVSADSSMERAMKQGNVVSRIEGGIAILKSEIKQDTNSGTNVEWKEEELAKMERKARRATEAQGSILGDANQTLKSAAKTEQSRKTGDNVSTIGKQNRDALISTTNLSKEKNFSFDIQG